MVHASLRRIGTIEGGTDTLLDALFESRDLVGTLLMALGTDGEVPLDALILPAERDIGNRASSRNVWGVSRSLPLNSTRDRKQPGG
ncbi:AAC(3) family N-acetyltransferase [Pelagibacterium lentulum]|uniref:Aminoglycoside N(3)-acetyltransferase n=1 Tax=Pelagibacterium lentulum TaxID=2029865 RepID=A0A916RIJ1_9HYPH|nr:hypothetical protein GCM10011499_29470 [Pelagibacterium lentulum]